MPMVRLNSDIGLDFAELGEQPDRIQKGEWVNLKELTATPIDMMMSYALFVMLWPHLDTTNAWFELRRLFSSM